MRVLVLSALIGLAAASQTFAANQPPLPEQADSDIGYPSPAAALTALKAKPGVKIKVEEQWYILSDPSDNSLWSIARQSNPAYPSAVKRSVIERDGALHLDMKVLCGSTKEACDDLVRAFQELNAQLKESIRGNHEK